MYTILMLIVEALKFKPIGVFTFTTQIILIVFLFVFALVTQHKEYTKTGKTYGRYPWRISTFLSSIYEEIIFRGIIFVGLLYFANLYFSIVISSVLFGLWHIKNYKWQTKRETAYQVLYTGIIFGPIASLITFYTGTIWLAVIVHYIHNILADLWRTKT